jgi:NodT family efflux transporter outer membrane factor (OMF) lipoprotein
MSIERFLANRNDHALRPSLALFFALPLMSALHGCASLAPPCVSPVVVEMPAAWSGAESPAVTGTGSLAQWWLRFNDPLLADLVKQALHANTSVASGEAALRQARAQRDVTAASLWPALGVSASAQHSTTGRDNEGNSFRAGLDASWEIDVFGGNRSALNASDANVRASAASLGDVQVSIAAEVALAYITLRTAQTRLAIATDNLASQRETLQITQWREQAGLVTALETEQATTQSEQTRAQLPLVQTSIEQTQHALAVLTGHPPAALSNLLTSAGPVPQSADSVALGIPAETLRQRPDVRAAEHQVTAALARVAVANAARAPSFRLSGSLGLNALTFGALTSGASVVSALLAAVSMPVFDGGAGRAQVRVQQAALEQAGVAYKAAVLAALKDVEDALVALRGSRERVLRLQRAAQSAATASTLARQRSGSGLVDFQTVLETQRSALGTQDSVASAQAEVAAGYVRLVKALGGGWQSDTRDSAT